MQVNQKSIIANGKKLTYTHLSNGSDTICYMFSGAGYTYEKPLLYYSTMVMLEKQYDVVHVHYSYEQEIFKLPLHDRTEIIYEDVFQVIHDLEKNYHYNETIFLGKSLGTIPIVNKLIKSGLYPNSKMILLTPLLKFDEVVRALLDSSHSAFIVIGEKDPHFISTKINGLLKKSNIKLEIVPNANHSLDIEPFNTELSIDVLNKVIRKLDEFLTNNRGFRLTSKDKRDNNTP